MWQGFVRRECLESGSLWFEESHHCGRQRRAKVKRSVIQRLTGGTESDNEGRASHRPGNRRERVRGAEPTADWPKRWSAASTTERAETEQVSYRLRMSFTEFSPRNCFHVWIANHEGQPVLEAASVHTPVDQCWGDRFFSACLICLYYTTLLASPIARLFLCISIKTTRQPNITG